MTSPRVLTRSTIAAALAAASLAGAVPAAHADTQITPAPGAMNLASGGGYYAWAAPQAGGGFRLTVRAPDGTISQPAIGDFAGVPDLSIGTANAAAAPDQRKLVLAYSRCEGASTLSGCDAYTLDLRTGAEEKIGALASKTYSETAVSVSEGRFSFVRRGGGTRKGVYGYTPGGALRRLSPQLARETQANGSRVAFVYNSSKGGGVALRRLSGEGATTSLTTRQRTLPTSLTITRYRAGWLQPVQGGVLATTTSRFGGSGAPEAITLERANRLLPSSTNAFVTDGSFYRAYLDAEGVKTIDPKIFAAG